MKLRNVYNEKILKWRKNLDTGNHNITNLSINTNDVLSAANVNYVNSAKAELTKSLTDS